MDKKKAVKLVTASAIAASAFVAANPNASEAASNVPTVVSQAKAQFKNAYYTYSHTVTNTGKFPDIKVVYNEYNKAKKLYADAVALVKKSGGANKDALLADLDATYNEFVAKRVVTYIDAYNYAVKLDAMRLELKAAVDAKDLAKAEELYHKISYELNKRTVILDRVYGQTTRDLLRSQFKAAAQQLRDSLVYDVTASMKLKAAEEATNSGDLAAAETALKAAEAALEKATAFKAELTAKEATVKAAYEAKLTPKVESVSAINAKELVVKFNKAVKKDTVVDGSGNLVNATVTAIGTATPVTSPKAALSEDGKTLTITATTKFDGEYAVTVPNTVKTITDEAVTAYSGIVKVADSVRPTVAEVSYSDYQTAVITFSEPLSDLGTISADNSAITFGSLSADGKSVTVNLASSSVKADTNYKVTIIGAKDFNGNLISPNPVELTVKKSTSDTVKPTVTSISTVNDKTFTITFSEKLIANPTIKVNGNTVVSGTPGAGEVQGTITKDATGLVYTVTLTDSLVPVGSSSALATITADFSDLSGNAADTYNKIVEFKKDTTAPELVSSSVEKINGKEYLVLNYNENVSVVDAKAINGKVVKDYVETPLSPAITTDTVDGGNGVNFELHNAVNGKSKSVRLDLATLTSGSYTLNLPAGLVTDEAGNDSKATTVTFNRTTNVDTGKPKLTTADTNGITKIDNNTYTVSFDRQLDPASALNVNNYTIEGAVVKSAIFTKNDSTGAVVRLTLEDNSVALTGERTVTIKNVASAAGVVMDPVVTTEVLTENVKPVVTSAQFVGLDKIKVVFSENIKESTVNAVGSTGDFDVVIGDVSETGASIAEDTSDTTGKTFIITLANPVTADEYAKTITLKAGTGLDVTDENGNALNFTSISVAK